MKLGGLRPPRTTPLSRSAPDSAIPIFQKTVISEKCLESLETLSKYSYGCQFSPCKARASYLVWVRSSDLLKFDLVTRPPGASQALNVLPQREDFYLMPYCSVSLSGSLFWFQMCFTIVGKLQKAIARIIPNRC